MFRYVLQEALEAEMDEALGCYNFRKNCLIYNIQ